MPRSVTRCLSAIHLTAVCMILVAYTSEQIHTTPIATNRGSSRAESIRNRYSTSDHAILTLNLDKNVLTEASRVQ